MGGTLTDNGATVINVGTIANAGTIAETQDVYSPIENLGTISSNGTITNVALLANNGTLINSGTINNLIGCTVAACGSLFSNVGVIVNKAEGVINNQANFGNYNANPRRPQLGNFTNYGILNNSRVFINLVGGTTTNSGILDNSGSITNFGALSNIGSFTNSGVVINWEYWKQLEWLYQ